MIFSVCRRINFSATLKLMLITVATAIFFCSCKIGKLPPDLRDGERTDSIRELIYKNEVSKLGLSDGDTLVDIGSGSGFTDFQLFHFYPKKYFILEDLHFTNSRMLKKTYIMYQEKKRFFRDHSRKIKGSTSTIPLESDRYNTVFCRITVHEFTDLRMIDEIRRILTKDGMLIVEEFIPKTKGELDAGCKKMHLTKDELTEMFNSHGFNLIAADTTTWPILKAGEGNLNILKFRKKAMP